MRDYLDITLYFEQNKIIKFALNYRGIIGNKWYEIYRVDNFHGFLHEQRFLRSRKPIPLDQEGKSNERVIEEFTDEIVMNFMKYKKYFEKSMKGGRNEKR